MSARSVRVRSVVHSAPAAARDDAGTFRQLRLYNLVVGLIHLMQAVALLLLSNDFGLPVTGQFLAGPPGSELTPVEELFSIAVGPAVAFFLFLAAVDHLLMAAPGVNAWYNAKLGKGINYARWWEYSVSASVMIVLIAMVTGVSDIGVIIAIFGVNAAMILFGMLMEMTNDADRKVNWGPYIFGCIAGIVPWIIITIQITGAETRATDGGVPTFVYGIIVSLFLLFNSFAINQFLQYKNVGKWREYIFGEKVYLLLSLTAKTALAWQVFANTLIE